jgi:two-component system LytT family response regulator
MKTILLYRSYLKRPWVGPFMLLLVVILYEILSWTLNPNSRIIHLNRYENLTSYIINWILGFYLPELVSILILTYLINIYHHILKTETLELRFIPLMKYELSFIPLFLVSYFIFTPFTITVRFLLRQFPNYSLNVYKTAYLPNCYALEAYLLYIPFIVIIGYLLLNISLGIDIFNNYTKQNSELEDQLILHNNSQSEESEYLDIIEGKNHLGETILAVRDCYFFESTERNYYAHHENGIFKISKSISSLETELDPRQFFRSNRNNIINLKYFDQYTYWEKGKYILQSTKNNKLELTMPRARLQNYKSALEINRKSQSENDL